MKGVTKNKTKSEAPRKQAARLEIISGLYKHGYTYRQIRTEVMRRLNLETYSLQQVHRDIHCLLNEWRESRIENVDENIQLELERINEMVNEAWLAWEKSKEDYIRENAKAIGMKADYENPDSEFEVVRQEQFKENVRACGDVRYLEMVNKLLSERRKLLGLYAPEKAEVVNKLSTLTNAELDKKIRELEVQLS